MKALSESLKSSRAVKITLGLLVLLVILDGFLTNLLIRHSIAREGNPLMVALAGTDKLIWIKIAGALISAVVLWDVYKHWPKAATIFIYAFTAIYTVIVAWNFILWLSPVA